ncbi:zinc-dependent alcohol dehydrogenase family protein [Egicoccus sp. AB-alg2]|uniref:zinc-dependent alcohol dehydrogenase family protein n=1 Tax=Egicoccus sp. AB-alg2 TaxID=3242693 RepID=UPI00359DE310
MRAWIVDHEEADTRRGLRLVERPDPEPGPGQVRVRVDACGVCRTDLHVVDGDLPTVHPHVVPGHEVVGHVDRLGPGAERFAIGDRVGVAWLRHTCGSCRPCRRGAENLCVVPQFTGWTHDGGYAEQVLAPQGWAYRLSRERPDEQTAPLLCAGIIGYRALRRSGFRPGDRLGMWGFGGSAHLTAQVALAMGAELYVVTRGAAARQLATELGAIWVGEAGEHPPVSLDAAISFAPAGDLVPQALASLDRGGVLSLAGIHVTEIPPLDYQRHLFQERELRSVTANTRADGEAFLALAERIGVHATVRPYPFEAADVALDDLANDRFAGAAVLQVRP